MEFKTNDTIFKKLACEKFGIEILQARFLGKDGNNKRLEAWPSARG